MENYTAIETKKKKKSGKIIINNSYRILEAEINELERIRNKINEGKFNLKNQTVKTINLLQEHRKNLDEKQTSHVIRTISTGVDV